MTTEETKVQPEDLLDRDLESLIEVGPDGVERLFGRTLEEIKALQREPTPELMEWAEKAMAEHIARYGE